MQAETLFARQAILDRNRDIAAYELLFRGGDPACVDGDLASSEVLLNAFQELDIAAVTAGVPAYINFTRRLILDPPPFDPNLYVVEILEDVAVDERLVAQVRALRAAGYTIALDDFEYRDDLADLVEQAHIVKIDVLAHDAAGLRRQVDALARFNVRLLAEKVETHEMFERCLRLGFDLFQGYFFSRPQPIEGTRVPANRVAVLALLARLQDPQADYEAIREVVANDSVLTVRIIKLVNSAALRRARAIDSLHDAIALLGLDQVRSWATMMALSRLSDKSPALLGLTLTRARFCALLGERVSPTFGALCFTAGLLSTADAFFDRPIAAVIGELPLSEDLRSAVTQFKGLPGAALMTVARCERANWNRIPYATLAEWGIGIDDVRTAYAEALRWSVETERQLQGCH